jgi:hypothetical protein
VDYVLVKTSGKRSLMEIRRELAASWAYVSHNPYGKRGDGDKRQVFTKKNILSLIIMLNIIALNS